MAAVKMKLARPLVLPLKQAGAKAETLSELVLDFDKLTGADVLAAERAMLQSGGGAPSVVRFLDASFQLSIAESASGIDAATLQSMGARDFVELLSQVQLFFMPTASDLTPAAQPGPSATPPSS